MPQIITIDGKIFTTSSLEIAASQSLIIKVDGVQHLHISNSKVGIGTNPATTFTLESQGHVGPYYDATYDLGSVAKRWRSIYGTDSKLTGSFSGSIFFKDGINNYFPKWVNKQLTGTSLIYDDGTNVGIGTSNPVYSLNVYKNTTDAILALSTGDPTNKFSGIYLMGGNDVEGTIRIDSGSTSPRDLLLESGTGAGSFVGIRIHGNQNISILPRSGSVSIGTVPIKYFQLTTSGSIGPSTTNTFDLGSSILKWRTIYGNLTGTSSWTSNVQSSNVHGTVESSLTSSYFHRQSGSGAWKIYVEEVSGDLFFDFS